MMNTTRCDDIKCDELSRYGRSVSALHRKRELAPSFSYERSELEKLALFERQRAAARRMAGFLALNGES
jgi:hypothetical protein